MYNFIVYIYIYIYIYIYYEVIHTLNGKYTILFWGNFVLDYRDPLTISNKLLV